MNKVEATTMVADVKLHCKMWLVHQAEMDTGNNKLANSAGNCYMTNNWKLLKDIEVLQEPVQVGMSKKLGL
jgi:hypothetical protein